MLNNRSTVYALTLRYWNLLILHVLSQIHFFQDLFCRLMFLKKRFHPFWTTENYSVQEDKIIAIIEKIIISGISCTS